AGRRTLPSAGDTAGRSTDIGSSGCDSSAVEGGGYLVLRSGRLRTKLVRRHDGQGIATPAVSSRAVRHALTAGCNIQRADGGEADCVPGSATLAGLMLNSAFTRETPAVTR